MKICKFLGKELKNEDIDSVVEHSSFNIMKENKMSNQSLAPDYIVNKNSFMRKGISGDWRTIFTKAQEEYFNRIYQEKMKNLDVKCLWDES
ncbi:hypothetical protein FKM82_013447 [Ascaphus truei]